MRLFPTLFLAVATFFFVSSVVYAQNGKLLVSGKVVDENKKGLQSEIKIYRGKHELFEITTTGIGKFELELPLNDSLFFVVTSDGYVSKAILAVTKVPDKFAKKEFQFPCFVDLYKVGDVPTYVDLDRPVGKIVFEGRQFIYDLEFTRAANRDLRQFINERKRMNVKASK